MSAAIACIKEKIMPFIDKESAALEIAPGSGDLANALAPNCKHYYTIDPSLVSLSLENASNLTHIQSFFEYEKLKNSIKHKISFIAFRHLLEHIFTPNSFLKEVVKLIENEGVIYIEVPNINEFIDNQRFYELFNDHCGYYQKGVLIDFMQKLNCEFIDELTLFNEQHMGLFFRKKEQNFTQKSVSFSLFDEGLKMGFENAIKALNKRLENYENIALYGAGAHANSILTFLSEANLRKIKLCFDLDVRKQGRFLQAQNIKIKSPLEHDLNAFDALLIAAPLYESEICEFLRKKGYNKDLILTRKVENELH